MAHMQIQTIYSHVISIEDDQGDDQGDHPLHHILSDDEVDRVLADLVDGDYVMASDLSEEALLLLRDVIPADECGGIEHVSIYLTKNVWCARLSAPGYMDHTDWVWSDTETEVLNRLSAEYDARLPDDHHGYVTSCPQCGAPPERAKLEHGEITASIEGHQLFDPGAPVAIDMKQANVRGHWLRCAACGATDISIADLIIDMPYERDED